jgi:hypothetical protein
VITVEEERLRSLNLPSTHSYQLAYLAGAHDADARRRVHVESLVAATTLVEELGYRWNGEKWELPC